MSLHVVESGLYTLVVDFGRQRSRSLGVPVGGAADRTALAIGNALVGNPPDAAALEVTLAGPTLEARCELACVVYGAPFELRCQDRRLAAGKTFTLHPGDRLQIGSTREGSRAYLCIAGGIQTRTILGSRSGLKPVQAGDDLPCLPGRVGSHFVQVQWTWDGGNEQAHSSPLPGLMLQERNVRLRCLPGAQSDWFPENILVLPDEQGNQPRWKISASSNRMGLRLDGPLLPIPQCDMLSEPVCPGTIQVTNDGRCIVLGVDSQTIGGYPKIAQVISADLDLLGQLRPGDEVHFESVTLEEAERLYAAKQAEINVWTKRIRTAVGS